MKKIFIVDDQYEITDLLEKVLKRESFDAKAFYNASSVIEVLKISKPDLMLLDIQMPGMDGLEALKIIKEIHPKLKIIIMTAYAERYKSKFFLQSGAIDFISKPFKLKDIRKLIANMLEKDSISHENASCKAEKIVGKSLEITSCVDKALKLSNSDGPILIYGESGTGKELIVDCIHYNSIRKHNKLVKINCAAIPNELLESEIFGYEKGAFTGATSLKKGKVEEANEGTLFLDEVSEMDEKLQTKLLRVLEYKSFERLGGNEQLFSDFRLICATNKNILEYVKKERFRRDLFYRINTFNLSLPPLRERKEDIPLLANHFIDLFRNDYVTCVKRINNEAIDVLKKHDWPGNIRELKNVIQRMISMINKEEITQEDVSLYISSPESTNGKSENIYGNDMVSLEELEKQHIIKVLRKVCGDKDRAVKILGISKKTLYNKIQKYSINS